MKEQPVKTNSNEIVKDLINKGFKNNFKEHMEYYSKMVGKKKPSDSVYFGIIKNKIKVLCSQYNWSDFRFKVVLWRIAEKNDNIFRTETYQKYEQEYLKNELLRIEDLFN